jgi:hypothetical protein
MNPPPSVNKDALVVLCVPDGAIESIIVKPWASRRCGRLRRTAADCLNLKAHRELTACWLRRSMRGVPTIER